MNDKVISANEDNDLMFRDGLINRPNSQSKVDDLLKKKNGEEPITEDVSTDDEKLQYFTE